jgi:hypothetical protein
VESYGPRETFPCDTTTQNSVCLDDVRAIAHTRLENKARRGKAARKLRHCVRRVRCFICWLGWLDKLTVSIKAPGEGSDRPFIESFLSDLSRWLGRTVSLEKKTEQVRAEMKRQRGEGDTNTCWLRTRRCREVGVHRVCERHKPHGLSRRPVLLNRGKSGPNSCSLMGTLQRGAGG